MSLLDIIKDLFCTKSTQNTETKVQAEVKPEPVAEVVESTPAPAPVATKKQSDKQSIPEDSTLRRHYLSNQEALKQAKYVEAVADKKPEPVVAEVTESVETVVKLQVPEDSTLRRHYIAGLKAEIESNMPACPTDAALKRHYEAQVQTELDKLLG